MEIPELDFNLNNLEIFDTNNVTRNVFNFSMEEAYAIITKEHKILDAYFLKALVGIYVILMVTGLFSNTMVWLVVARRAQMRTPRNFYVVNLTVSDISLCLISMPFTLVNFIETQWNLGLVLCKLVPVIQGCNIFVSTGTVMAIALDRYFTVVRSCGAPQDKYRVLLSIGCIWIISCLFCFPILLYQVLEEENIGGLLVIRRCIEKWPSSSMRAAYTFGLLVFQLVIPILVLAGVHVAIANHLNAHTMVPNGEKTGVGGKSLLKKSFLRNSIKRNVLHLRLDESTMITDDTKSTSILGNGGGGENKNTLYNIPMNDAHNHKRLEGDENEDSVKCTVYSQQDIMIPLQVYAPSSNHSHNNKQKKIDCPYQVDKTMTLPLTMTTGIENPNQNLPISDKNNSSQSVPVPPDKNEADLALTVDCGVLCDGQSSVMNDSRNGDSVTIVDGSANPKRSPLNVKFKSNIGVCITFRDFCQLSTGRSKGGTGEGIASSSTSTTSSIEEQERKSKKQTKQQQLELGEYNLRCKKLRVSDKKDRNGDEEGFLDNLITETQLDRESMEKVGERGDQEKSNIPNRPSPPSPETMSMTKTEFVGGESGQLERNNKGNCHGSPGVRSLTGSSQMASSLATPTSMLPITSAVSKRTKKELARNRRTTIILLSVAVIFTISWMPWHLLTLWADLHPNFTSTSNLYMFFAIAHILAMTSAVTNAILYGWFNTNLRRELLQMLSSWIKR